MNELKDLKNCPYCGKTDLTLKNFLKNFSRGLLVAPIKILFGISFFLLTPIFAIEIFGRGQDASIENTYGWRYMKWIENKIWPL